MHDIHEFSDRGEPIIEVGEPIGFDAKYFAGKSRVAIGRRYLGNVDSQVFFLSEAELKELFSAIGNRLIELHAEAIDTWH